MKINFDGIKRRSAEFALRYPVEIVMSITFFILAEVVTYFYNYGSDNKLWAVLPYFPITLFVSYACNCFFKDGKRRLIYYLSILTIAPLFVINMEPYVMSVGYGFGLLLSAFLLLVCKGAKSNEEFAANFVTIIIDLLVTALVGLVAGIAISAIWGTISYIFGIGKDLFKYIWEIEAFLIVPLTFLYLQMKHQNGWETTVPQFIKIVINYIICPAVIIYTVILYVYAVKILIAWELPLGGLALMIMIFYIVALMARMMQTIAPMKLYDWYFKYFSYISVPLLVLFWVGILYRIEAYSFTQSRVYLVAAGALMTFCSVMLLSSRAGNYRLITILASALIIVLTYIPGISAKSIGVICQENRLEELMTQLNIRNPKTGKLLIKQDDFVGKSKQWSDSIKEVVSIYDYLDTEMPKKEVTEKYGDRPQVYFNEKGAFGKVGSAQCYSCPANINLGKYRYFNTNENNNGIKGELIGTNYELRVGGKKVLVENVDFNKANKYISADKELPASTFTLKNDSVMVILRKIWISENPKSCSVSEVSVFSARPLLIEK